jgi:hypothetical protein
MPTYPTLNDCEMQHNAEAELFTKPSIFRIFFRSGRRRKNSIELEFFFESAESGRDWHPNAMA